MSSHSSPRFKERANLVLENERETIKQALSQVKTGPPQEQKNRERRSLVDYKEKTRKQIQELNDKLRCVLEQRNKISVEIENSMQKYTELQIQVETLYATIEGLTESMKYADQKLEAIGLDKSAQIQTARRTTT